MRAVLLLPLLVAACDAPQPGDADWDPFAEADASLPWQAPPPSMALGVAGFIRPGAVNTLTISGDLGEGERVYIGATTSGTGNGPCIPAAGGLCLDIRSPRLIGTALADADGVATFAWPAPPGVPIGANVSLQALVVRSIGGVDSFASAPVTRPALDLPPEGTVLSDWTELDFTDNGYRDDCAGGAKWVKSTPYAAAKYVGVTLCGPRDYKIWMSDLLHGTFVPVADWSGTGQDHCEYVGGDFLAYPNTQPTAVGANQPCWSRGAPGTEPTYEPVCANNRWMPWSITCTAPVPTPAGLTEGMTLNDWEAFDFYDDGYRDDCAGGAKYVTSTGFPTARYVGVTLCNHVTYKIWVSDRLFGSFYSMADWSGTGQDHCELVGGVYNAFPGGSTAVDPNQPCWSRGPAGVEPTFEAVCSANRWVPRSYDCSIALP